MDTPASGAKHSANSNIHSSTQSLTIQKNSAAKVLASSRALADSQAHKQITHLMQAQQAATPPQQSTAKNSSQQETQEDAAGGVSKDARKSSGSGGGIGSVFASAIRRLSHSGSDSSAPKGQGPATSDKQQQPVSGVKQKDMLGGGSSFKALRGVLSFKGTSSSATGPAAATVGGNADPVYESTARRVSQDQSRPSLHASASVRVSSTSGKDLDPGSGRSSTMKSNVRGGLSYELPVGNNMQSQARAMTKAMTTLGADDFQTSSDDEPAARGYQPAMNHRTSDINNNNHRMVMQMGSIKRTTTSDDEFD